jgi:hypothetical protein
VTSDTEVEMEEIVQIRIKIMELVIRVGAHVIHD